MNDMIETATPTQTPTTEYSGKPVADVPFSASRVYLPHERTVDGVVFNALPSGREYVRMPDGSLRRVKEVKTLDDGSIGVKI